MEANDCAAARHCVEVHWLCCLQWLYVRCEWPVLPPDGMVISGFKLPPRAISRSEAVLMSVTPIMTKDHVDVQGHFGVQVPATAGICFNVCGPGYHRRPSICL